MTRRDMLAAVPLALAALDGQEVALLMRVVDGAIVSGDSRRAREWVLSPGSTVKPFVFQALLQSRRLQPTETFLCSGELHVNGHNMSCSHPRGLPPMDVARAIAYSCNSATAHFAQRFTLDELVQALRMSGFKVTTAADIRLMALGEEGVFVTPFELAHAYQHLAQSAEPAVREGLESAVKFGTAQLAAVPGLRVGGKTGSAITSSGLHAAWFAGFEPSDKPEYVAAVAVQGRSGGADAAPVAAALFRRQVTGVSASSREETYRVRFGGAVSTLTVEDYVAAVLAGEASVFRQAEALRAMAVAARTYAANQRGRHASEGFDFCSTTHCQRAELGNVTAQLAAAARATTGEILRFQGAPAFTPYTRSCSGMTESGATVWPELQAPYLRVQKDDHCQPSLMWTCELTLAAIERTFRSQGLRCPTHLHSVAVMDRTESGRARRLLLEGDGTETVSAGAFRFAIGRSLGWNKMRSEWFDVTLSSPGSVSLHGKGEGRGVGLCQRGAEGMAAQGFTYRDILAFYYPGLSTAKWIRMGGEGIAVYVTDAVREARLLPDAERIVAHLPWRPEETIEIYAHPTIDEFRNVTHEPGWVAARSVGRRIDIQPIDLLMRRGILNSTLRHELLHVAVESRAVAGLPVWFREGVVEWLAGDHRVNPNEDTPSDRRLRDRANRAEAFAGYREARAKVADLVARYGEETVLDWVTQGLPDEVRNSTVRMPPTKSK